MDHDLYLHCNLAWTISKRLSVHLTYLTRTTRSSCRYSLAKVHWKYVRRDLRLCRGDFSRTRHCLTVSNFAKATPHTLARVLPLVQVFKFAVYLGVPISLTAWVINRKASIESLDYVRYPSEESTHSYKDIESALSKARRK